MSTVNGSTLTEINSFSSCYDYSFHAVVTTAIAFLTLQMLLDPSAKVFMN